MLLQKTSLEGDNHYSFLPYCVHHSLGLVCGGGECMRERYRERWTMGLNTLLERWSKLRDRHAIVNGIHICFRSDPDGSMKILSSKEGQLGGPA